MLRQRRRGRWCSPRCTGPVSGPRWPNCPGC